VVKTNVIGYRRSLTKGRKVVNFSSLLCAGHPDDPLILKAWHECLHVEVLEDCGNTRFDFYGHQSYRGLR
jgi:hypothetical protein